MASSASGAFALAAAAAGGASPSGPGYKESLGSYIVQCSETMATEISTTRAIDMAMADYSSTKRKLRDDHLPPFPCSKRIRVSVQRPTTYLSRPPAKDERKPITLVLDLDRTLLNSTDPGSLSPDEKYLLHHPQLVDENLPEKNLFMWNPVPGELTMTKLRPFVREFLKKASNLFDICIYTLGSRPYAHGIAKILDPDGVYFSKIISRDDTPDQWKKSLHFVPRDEKEIIIVDDREDVWQDHGGNLICIKGYDYFASSFNVYGGGLIFDSLSESKDDEDDAGGALFDVLAVLEQVHMIFTRRDMDINLPGLDVSSSMDIDLPGLDVRTALRAIRLDILRDCNIVFKLPAKDQSLWNMAKNMGANCSDELDAEKTTHVVSWSGRSESARWAVKNGKFPVLPLWIKTAFYSWRRQEEEDFSSFIMN